MPFSITDFSTVVDTLASSNNFSAFKGSTSLLI